MPVSPDREYRDLTGFEIRQDETEETKMTVSGQFTTFDSPYLLSSFEDDDAVFESWEVVARGAFDEADTSDVIMQYDHRGRVFARTSNGTLSLDFSMPSMTADLGGTTLGKQLYEEIRGGYTTKMSYGYTVAADTREQTVERREGMKPLIKMTRTINKIKKLYDVSAVSLPANNQTSISARCLGDGLIDEAREEYARMKQLEITRAKAEARARLLKIQED